MRRLLLCLPFLAAGCGSVEPYLGDAPKSLEGFPIQTTEGQIYATASLGDPERHFGVDLVDEARAVPILLKAHKNEDAENRGVVELFPRQMNLRLFLADGTVLERVQMDELDFEPDDAELRQLNRRRFRGGPLKAEDLEGYVFFQLPPENLMEVEGSIAQMRTSRPVMSIDLRKSVLAFDWTLGDGGGRQTFFVGVDS